MGIMKRLLTALLVIAALIPCIGVFVDDPAIDPSEIPVITPTDPEPVIDPEPEPEPQPPVVEIIEIKTISPEKDRTFTLVNDEIKEFLRDYERGIGQKYYQYQTDHFTGNQTVHLQWMCSKEPEYSVVYVSRYPDMSRRDEYLSYDNSLYIDNLYTGSDYYWQVYAVYDGFSVRSEVSVFHTADTPRIVLIDGVSNTRDVGGYLTESGVRIRQGLLYRTGTVDGVNDTGRKQATQQLHVKTELDLRDAGESGARLEASPLGEPVTYVNIPGVLYSNILKEENYETACRTFALFADPSNYPILYHCQAGRDRTGTVTIILLGLCGVPEETIYKEYELAFFSRAGTEMDEGGREVEILLNYVSTMLERLGKFGDEDATLAGCCREYLLTVGLTPEQIEMIRHILTEESDVVIPGITVDAVIPEVRE